MFIEFARIDLVINFELQQSINKHLHVIFHHFERLLEKRMFWWKVKPWDTPAKERYVFWGHIEDFIFASFCEIFY